MSFKKYVEKDSPKNERGIYSKTGKDYNYWCDGVCWGGYLNNNSQPDEVVVSSSEHSKECLIFYEWAMNTGLLKDILITKDIDWIVKYGWHLEADKKWSSWYLSGLFCRSFNESVRYAVRHYNKNYSIEVNYWACMLLRDCGVGGFLNSRHGWWASDIRNINTNEWFNFDRPKVKEYEERGGFYTGDLEVHSFDHCYGNTDVRKHINIGLKKFDWYKKPAPYRSVTFPTNFTQQMWYDYICEKLQELKEGSK